MLSTFRRQIDDLKQTLNMKRGAWQIAFDAEKDIYAKLAPATANKIRLSNEIEKLEGAIRALEGDSGPQVTMAEPIAFRLPDISASMAEPWYEYAYSPVVRAGRYDMEYVLVNKEYMVFKCDCPAFRFTKGELANGKTCKHIDSYTNAKAESSEAFKARRAFINLRALRRGTGIGFKRGCYNFF